LPDGESGIFFSRGLDSFLLICPSGCFAAGAAAGFDLRAKSALAQRIKALVGAANVNTAALRASFVEYWLKSIRSLGTHPATGIPLIVGEKNQRLYWLVFLSSNPLGQKLWNHVQNLSGQGSLFEGL
jgi:hypothetical protein